MPSQNSIPISPSWKQLCGLFALFVTVNGVLVTLAIMTYGQRFLFWEYALSDLGATKTLGGMTNPALYFYDADMIVSGIIMFYIALTFRRSTLKERRTYSILSLIAAFGFMIAIAPDDILDPVHIIGSAPMFGCLWLLATLFLVELKPRMHTYQFYALQAYLHVPILAYGITFLLAEPSRHLFQKWAVLALFLTLIFSTYRLARTKEIQKEQAVLAVE